jgi:hypothetical protein
MNEMKLFGTILFLGTALFAQEDGMQPVDDSLPSSGENASVTGKGPSHADESVPVTGSTSHSGEIISRTGGSLQGAGESMSHAERNGLRAEENKPSAEESSPRYELGAIIGEPTGISGKVWMSRVSAIDGAIAWGLTDENFLHLHADLLVHNYKWLHVSNRVVPVFAGVGGVVRLAKQKSAQIGLRLPVGVAYMFYYFPLDIFVEIAPILELVPSTSFNFNGGIGLRFMFGKSAG